MKARKKIQGQNYLPIPFSIHLYETVFGNIPGRDSIPAINVALQTKHSFRGSICEFGTHAVNSYVLL